MLNINKKKLHNIKRLLIEDAITTPMLLKLLNKDITVMKEKFKMSEILIVINLEFETNIKYTTFQRTLYRLNSANDKTKTTYTNVCSKTKTTNHNFNNTHTQNIDDEYWGPKY